MPQKRDPVLAVLTYFETAELALAQQALALAQATLKRRQPKVSSNTRTARPRAVKPPQVATVGD